MSKILDLVKPLVNSIEYWFVEGRDCHGEDLGSWWALTSVMFALLIGFCFLAWFLPKVSIVVFAIFFLPGFIQIYIRFSDKKIDSRISQLRKLIEKENEHKRNRW